MDLDGTAEAWRETFCDTLQLSYALIEVFKCGCTGQQVPGELSTLA